jgi:heavy metal efflux system protein
LADLDNSETEAALGRPDNGSDASGFFNAEFFVPLKPFDEWPAGLTKEKLVEDLQTEFAKEFTGITFNFSQYIQDNIEEGLSGVKGANSVKIIGPDLAKLEEIANLVLPEMDKVKGVADLQAIENASEYEIDTAKSFVFCH